MTQLLQEAPTTNRIARDDGPDRSQAALLIYQLAAKVAEIAGQVAQESDLDRVAAISDWCVEQTERLEHVSTTEVAELFSIIDETSAKELPEPSTTLLGYFAETADERRQRLKEDRAERIAEREARTKELLEADDREGLFHNYLSIVIAYARKLQRRFGFDDATCEDVSQAGRLGIWKASHTFVTGKGDNFSAYVFVAMSRSVWGEWLRLKRQERGFPSGDVDYTNSMKPGFSDELADTELIGVAYRKMKELPATTQLILCEYFDGKQKREIAKQFNLSESAISRSFFWGVEQMHDMVFPLVIGAWRPCPCFVGDVWNDLEAAQKKLSSRKPK